MLEGIQVELNFAQQQTSKFVPLQTHLPASTNGSGTSGGKSGSCFPASAAVHTPHGARTMDSLRVGDQVGVQASCDWRARVS